MLSYGARISNVESVPDNIRQLQHFERDVYQILYIDELHETMALARKNHRAACAESVPQERLAVIRITRTVHKMGPQRGTWKPRKMMQSKSRSRTAGLVAG